MSLVKQVHVEHLAKASRRRSLRLVRTVPGHLTNARRRRSMSLVKQVHVEPKAQLEVSANGTWTLNECETKTKHEFSETGACRAGGTT